MMTTQLLASRPPALPSERAWSELDRLFHPFADAPAWKPRVDVVETEAEFRVAAELPGLEEKDIDVALEDGVLTIRGERKVESEGDDGDVLRVETWRGAFRRSLRLPAAVDADAIKATYRVGILTVTLPKAPEARVRNIPIRS